MAMKHKNTAKFFHQAYARSASAVTKKALYAL